MRSLDVAVKLDDHPLKYRSSSTGPFVEGSCDGLLLIHKLFGDVAIWNPSSRKYHKLPSTSGTDLKPLDYYVTVCGFGYDEVHDDYKVVKVVQYLAMDEKTFCSEVRVYSLKSNSWRRIREFPYYLYYNKFYGNMVGGALHWVASRDGTFSDNYDCFIVAVDLINEEYRLVPMPNFADKKFHMGVSVLEGCLCILCNYSDQRYDVWVMKEYGVRESWTKLVSVTLPKGWPLEFVVPFDYSKDGTKVLLLQRSNKLVWFDLKRKEVHEMVNVCGLPNLFGAVVYGKSLVQGSNAKKQQIEEIKETKPKRIEKKRDGFLSVGFKLKL